MYLGGRRTSGNVSRSQHLRRDCERHVESSSDTDDFGSEETIEAPMAESVNILVRASR